MWDLEGCARARPGLTAPRFADASESSIRVSIPPVTYNYFGAFLRKFQGGGTANSRCRSGGKRHLFTCEVDLLLPSCLLTAHCSKL